MIDISIKSLVSFVSEVAQRGTKKKKKKRKKERKKERKSTQSIASLTPSKRRCQDAVPEGNFRGLFVRSTDCTGVQRNRVFDRPSLMTLKLLVSMRLWTLLLLLGSSINLGHLTCQVCDLGRRRKVSRVPSLLTCWPLQHALLEHWWCRNEGEVGSWVLGHFVVFWRCPSSVSCFGCPTDYRRILSQTGSVWVC